MRKLRTMIRYSILNVALVVAVAIVLRPGVCLAAPHADGELRIEIKDAATGEPIAARMHLYAGRNANPAATTKRPAKLNIPGSAEYGGHFYIDGKATLPLRMGAYTFELEAGP